MGSFLWCGGLPNESYADNEVFLPDDEEKRTFVKECATTDALVQIGGMLLDAVQIRHDSYEVRRRQLYGPPDALVWPRSKPNAKCKLTFSVYNALTNNILAFLKWRFSS